jgi:tRNA dimethylallyltransferase
MNKNVIVITGPTGSGKTDFALKLADIADIEIISADSRQIYKYLNIGTAKPKPEELAKVKHHLIDYLNPDEDFSAGKFADTAKLLLNQIIESGKIPVIVGGTGFYIKALFEGLSEVDDNESEEAKEIREKYDLILKNEGRDHLYGLLAAIDMESAAKYSDKNPRRIIRALEHFELTGNKFSDTFGSEKPSEFSPQYYVVNPSREELYKRINDRTDLMFRNGLIKETAAVVEMGYPPTLNSLNTVGYKECISMIFGEIPIERAIELTKQNTRKYAKRQVTWLNQIQNYREFARSSSQLMQEMIDKYNKI